MRHNEPLYVISVAARLLELHPQTLRKYEREGFVAPSRTTGNLRLYSAEDLESLRQVKHLVENRGINLAGVEMALQVTKRLHRIHQRLAALDGEQNSPLREVVEEVEDTLRLLGYSVRR
ncbi:MAG: MerR family transcriptional regulator [Sphaerobacteraceae bacterium]|nr:MAG: MerR family transcriptional regulator [Sphaerobacteraceae bacterium]